MLLLGSTLIDGIQHRFLNVLSCFPQLVSLFTFDSLGWCFQWAVYTSRTFQKVSRSYFRIRVGLFLPRFISHARSGVKFCLLPCPWGSCQNQDFWESAAVISLEYSAFFTLIDAENSFEILSLLKLFVPLLSELMV